VTPVDIRSAGGSCANCPHSQVPNANEGPISFHACSNGGIPTASQVIITRWKSIARNGSAEACAKDDFVGFFRAFRPNGRGLEEALAGVVGAESSLKLTRL
jgi:hypothetical protein